MASPHYKQTSALTKLLYSGYFSPGENFRQFRHLLTIGEILSVNFFLHINDYTVDVVTFIALLNEC